VAGRRDRQGAARDRGVCDRDDPLDQLDQLDQLDPLDQLDSF
jgi:hypothetical protein